MGQATILQNIGDGLYRIRLDFDLSRIEAELERLEEQEQQSAELLLDALETVAELRSAKDAAQIGVNAVIEQWKQNLITAENEVPADIEHEVSFEQADDLFDALNDERSDSDSGATALTRSTALDMAARDYLASVAATGRLDDPKSPGARAKQNGYSADDEVAVVCLCAPGADSAISAAAKLADKPAALSPDYEQAGAAYLYAPTTSWTYLWCVTLGKPEKEHSENLLDAINAEREAEDLDELERNDALDVAARRLIEVLAATGRTEDLTSDPESRAELAGFNVDTSVGVEYALGFGQTDAESVISTWMARAKESGALLGADYKKCGISYIHRPTSGYRHYWCAFFSAPGSGLDIDWPDDEDEDNPAREAAEESTDELDRIELPKTETYQPKKLPEAVADFAQAVAAYLAADAEVARLQVEQAERRRRITKLNEASQPLDIYAWCCQYVVDLQPGEKVQTAEVPGYLNRRTTSRTTTLSDGRVIHYEEWDVNIIPNIGSQAGQLVHAI
ncbi:CAP domain-containing protein [Thiocystis violacea]|uniref:CAP domain-containing protein n=1 Tax=Thiocystis violacea TaxID=13725 RepID=UPI001908DA0C|nr:CAP domain-containing protein [Thiocystis violacea]MBK1716676.1 hypothetical protein [Thiocystis violacea]